MPSAAAPYCLSLTSVSTSASSAVSLLEACLPVVASHSSPQSRHIMLSHLWSTHSIMFYSSQSKGNAGWMNPPDSDDFIVYLTEITVAGGRKQRFPGGKGAGYIFSPLEGHSCIKRLQETQLSGLRQLSIQDLNSSLSLCLWLVVIIGIPGELSAYMTLGPFSP